MKKAIILVMMVGIMTFPLTACQGASNVTSSAELSEASSAVAAKESSIEETKEPEKIELTAENIGDYIKFDGEFVDGEYTMSIVNYAKATLEFQAYPVVSGKFNNVEITVIATSDDHTFTYMNSLGNYWHLTDDDKDTKNIEFTFTLGVDGKFSKKYSCECLNNTGTLDGSCDFTIVSVNGTYVPE